MFVHTCTSLLTGDRIRPIGQRDSTQSVHSVRIISREELAADTGRTQIPCTCTSSSFMLGNGTDYITISANETWHLSSVDGLKDPLMASAHSATASLGPTYPWQIFKRPMALTVGGWVSPGLHWDRGISSPGFRGLRRVIFPACDVLFQSVTLPNGLASALPLTLPLPLEDTVTSHSRCAAGTLERS